VILGSDARHVVIVVRSTHGARNHSHVDFEYVTMKDSAAETDGSFRLRGPDGNVLCHAFILEAKEGVGEGGCCPSMQSTAYFGRVLSGNWGSDFALSTCYPALAMELCGNMFRWKREWDFRLKYSGLVVHLIN